MLTPLLNRLKVIEKQIVYLNDLLNKTVDSVPESLVDQLRDRVSVDISGLKDRMKQLHKEIGEVMSKTYKVYLDSVERACTVESYSVTIGKKVDKVLPD